MIDPLLSLAISIHANPGVFAVLLGSGVSRSVGIPTGWEIVLDLIHRLAKLHGEDCEPDCEAWFKAKYGEEPTYSGLLDAVAKSQAERSRLLAGYFEPTGDDQEQGLKTPTVAHRSVARLVKSGHIKLIITTNFDRLIEQALETIGIAPTVISSPDAVEGAMPIVHSRCTVVKLHGDYMDIRTKNTPIELDAYDVRIDHLLDHVLDEFGLVVCGWSGEWDTALRKAMERCKNRRFTTYWTVKGTLGQAAKTLLGLRAAQTLSIEGADGFFSQLAEKVETLSELDRPHPLSAKVAVVQAKKYLVEPKYRIQLHDLLMQEVERIVQQTGLSNYPVTGNFENKDAVKRFVDFETSSEIAIAIVGTGCFWGTEHQWPLWVEAINRLANPWHPQSCNMAMQALRSYPALLLLYAGGIACVSANRYETLLELFRKPKVRDGQRLDDFVMGLFDRLPPKLFKILPDLERMKFPRSERLFKILREPFREIIPDDDSYERTFDRYEALQSLWTADTTGWAMPGVFMYRHDRFKEGSVLTEIVNENKVSGADWPLFKTGFFGGESGRWERALQNVEERAKGISWM